jgi:CheY-like chemotaxis protein
VVARANLQAQKDRMNLLIVDDIPTNLRLLRAQMESEGHAVFEANDGLEALALLNYQQVDAVISDILMPRMDGYRLCHEIRQHARLHDLPIIIYTATYTLPSDEKLALEVGADKYLKKPTSVEALVAALHEVMVMPHTVSQPKALHEVEVLKEYSEALVRKLEEKALKLVQSNRDLAAREAHLSAIFRSDPECIKLLADDGSLLEMNPAGLRMIEADSFEQVANRCIYPFVDEEYRNAFRELTEKVFRGGSGTHP